MATLGSAPAWDFQFQAFSRLCPPSSTSGDDWSFRAFPMQYDMLVPSAQPTLAARTTVVELVLGGKGRKASKLGRQSGLERGQWRCWFASTARFAVGVQIYNELECAWRRGILMRHEITT